MKFYELTPIGRLYAVRACLKGKKGNIVLKLLVDTGSTYTIVPVEALEAIGMASTESKDHVRIITGSGILMAPRVSLPALHCFGREFKNFPVIGHTLPSGSPVDGLLGMDLMVPIEARIDLQKGTIELAHANEAFF